MTAPKITPLRLPESPTVTLDVYRVTDALAAQRFENGSVRLLYVREQRCLGVVAELTAEQWVAFVSAMSAGQSRPESFRAALALHRGEEA